MARGGSGRPREESGPPIHNLLKPEIGLDNGVHFSGALLPLGYLNQVLNLSKAADVAAQSVVNIVVLQAEDRQFGLVVDGVNDTQEIVVKPLGKQLKGMTCYAGATIMGDGKVALGVVNQ